FVALAPVATPRLREAAIDVRVLGLALGITVLVAILSGLVPAFRSAGAGTVALRESRGSAGRRRLRFQSTLVAVEIALALILVTGSALLLRSFAALLRADPGFDASGLVVADIRPPGAIDAAGQRQFFERVLDRASGLSGVRGAGLLYTAPGSGGGMWSRISGEGADPSGPVAPFTRITPVMGDAFGTLGIRMRAGRAFGAVRAGDPLVVVLNESAARAIFPGIENPVGRHLRFGVAGSDAPLREVVGVVDDVAQRGPGEEREAQIYAPAAQQRILRYSLVLRMQDGVPPPAGAIRALVNEVGSGVPVDRIATMNELFAESTAESRFLAFLLSTFALLALILAVVGTYGTASYAVTRRLREMGIRLALGAGGPSILGLMLGSAAAAVAAGVMAGTVMAFALSRFLASYVFGITAHDPLSFLAAAVLIALAAIVASLVPALRAARVDPNRVLRMDV
ncbi:MAG: ABC transporter permease, partial [Gemmatimonadota bacterium]